MKKLHSRQRIAVAVAGLLLGLAAPTGRAAVTITGSWSIDPFEPGPLNGPHLSRPGSRLWLGTAGDASFSALAGSVVDLYTLTLAAGPGSTVTGVLDGAGTALVLRGNGNTNRLEVGNTGNGSLLVSGGALIDGRAEGWRCLEGNGWCNNFIGNAAGSTGQLTVTGAGSEVRMQKGFFVASLNLGNGWGTVGGTTTGRVEVLNGGRMLTDSLFAGSSWTNNLGNGQERSLAFITVAGANSTWEVAGVNLGTGDAQITLAHGPLATTQAAIGNGGMLRANATSGHASLRMADGGHATTTVDQGRIELLSPLQSFVGVGLQAGGQGDLLMNQGVLRLQAPRTDLQVGAGGAQGLLQARGGEIRLNASADSAIGIGIEGGQGELALSEGATLSLTGSNSRYVVVGRGAGGDGRLSLASGASFSAGVLDIGARSGVGHASVDGVGTLLTLSNPVESHRLAVGASGHGSLTVSGGALLDASVDAAACAGRWCGSFIGQMAGDTARFTVTGAGSEARFLAGFNIGEISVARPAIEGWTGGEVNGATQARVEVLAGGRLLTEDAHAGGWFYSASQGGGERSFVDLVVSGPGSTWLIAPGALANRDANLNLARTPGAVTTLDISDGGLLRLQAQPGRQAAADLTAGRYAPGDPRAGGGRSVTTVRGAGSRFEIDGDTARMAVANGAGGTALLQVKEGGTLALNGASWSYLNIGESDAEGRVEILGGGRVSGARHVNVGAGGQGSLLVDGAGSLLTTDRNGSFVGQLNVGLNGQGWLDVRNGGAVSAFSLQVGGGSDPALNHGEAVIHGNGTQVVLDAVNWHRLAIRNGGVRVSGGALLDATVDSAACSGGTWCGVFIANDAGNTGSLIVSDNGSTARFLSNFNVGQANVTAPPATPWSLGDPGATSLAQVHVLAGGRLETEQVYVAQGSSGPAADGNEGVIAQLRIKGPGSTWLVSGANGRAASFMSGMGNAANTLSDMQITEGGQLVFAADANTAAYVQLGFNGGVHRMSVTGAGSKVVYGATSNAGFWIGRNGATASLALGNGGVVDGINRLQVGNTGATGTLSVDGTGSRIDYGSRFADLYIGRQGGVGHASITGGGVINLDSWQPRLYVGSGDGDTWASGTLRINGAGSLLDLQSPVSAAGAFDLPQANIGWGGTGTVEVSGGGQLRLNGRGMSTPSQVAQTRMTIGQTITTQTANGPVTSTGTGALNIGGSGSRVSVAGTDAVVYVGRNPGGTGTLNLSAGALLETTLLDVGLGGGAGTLQANASSIALSGQHSGNNIGATLGIGLGQGALGSVRLANGSSLTINNGGDKGSLLIIGGSNNAPGGNGSLVVRASSVQISGQSGATAAIVGYNGSGLASFENGSLLDLGSHAVVVGWKPGSTGALNVSGGSTVQAGYVGVGATTAEGDGGVATLVVNDSSTLMATTIEIGNKGYVGGTGTLVGSIINRGVFNPGNSPGTLNVQGSFENQAGGRLVMEVESDGQGGFLTDQLVFDAGALLNLGSVHIEFRFLGATDPNAFQASGGFGIDSFLRQGNAGLDHGLLAGASYSASSSAYQFTGFSFTADGGAVFQAQAVPEPGTWVMFVLGLGFCACLQRRRGRP